MIIVNEINAGDIGAMIGIKCMRSGETFIDELDHEEIMLKGMKLPPPVFFCSIESENFQDSNRLGEVLDLMCLEDPTINVKFNE